MCAPSSPSVPFVNNTLAKQYRIPARPYFVPNDPWLISIDNETKGVSRLVLDNIMCSSNGRIGMKSQSDMALTTISSEIFVNGAYHTVPIEDNIMVGSAGVSTEEQVGASIGHMEIKVHLNGQVGTHKGYVKRALDMKNGLYQCIAVHTSLDESISFEIEHVRLASLSRHETWYSKLRVFNVRVVKGKIARPVEFSIDISFSVDSRAWLVTPLGNHTESTETSSPVEVEEVRQISRSSGVTVQSVWVSRVTANVEVGRNHLPLKGVTCMNMKPNESVSALQDSVDRGAWTQASNTLFTFKITPDTDEEAVLELNIMHFTPVNEEASKQCALLSAAELTKRQSEILKEFWEENEISVGILKESYAGRLTQALRYSAFVLFCNGHGTEARYGLTRCGLSCAGTSNTVNLQSYLFHGIFFAFTAPNLALNLIHHVYSLLPGARALARSMSIPKGALYPQKTITGIPCGRFTPSSSARFHLNADLAYFIFLFLDIVQNEERSYRNTCKSMIPVAEKTLICEILLETARLWLYIGMWSDSHSTFTIDNVSGIDEYSGISECRFYTNLSAKIHMRKTYQIFLYFRQRYALEALELMQKIEMSESELESLREVSNAILVSKDDRKGIYMEHAHFDELLPWPIASHQPLHPLEQNYHSIVIFRHKVVQVPEVLLGMLLYEDRIDISALPRCIKYYEPCCTHDHPTSLAVVAASKFKAFGDAANATDEFASLCFSNIDNTSFTADDGLKLSGMSTAWFALAIGVGGVRTSERILNFRPCLPVEWESCVFCVHWMSSVIRVAIDASTVSYTLIKGTRCRFVHDQKVRVLLDSVVRPRVAISRLISTAVTSYFDGIIITLESVVENMDFINFTAWDRVLAKYFAEIERRKDLTVGDGGRIEGARSAVSHPLAGEEGTGVAERVRGYGSGAIPRITFKEYIDKIVYQQEETVKNYTGIQKLLEARGLNLPVGSPDDAEIVESRYGLANAKLTELRDMLGNGGTTFRLIPGVGELLQDAKLWGLRVAVVSFMRNINEVLLKFNLGDYITTTISGFEAREKLLQSRPSTGIFDHAAEKMHLQPGRCVVITKHADRGYDIDCLKKFFAWIDIDGDEKDGGCSENVVSFGEKELPTSVTSLEDDVCLRLKNIGNTDFRVLGDKN